nr:hypothetical protein CFP56_76615 [Quercus suber]
MTERLYHGNIPLLNGENLAKPIENCLLEYNHSIVDGRPAPVSRQKSESGNRHRALKTEWKGSKKGVKCPMAMGHERSRFPNSLRKAPPFDTLKKAIEKE